MLVKSPAVSASAAEETTTLMTPVGLSMGPLCDVSVVVPHVHVLALGDVAHLKRCAKKIMKFSGCCSSENSQ